MESLSSTSDFLVARAGEAVAAAARQPAIVLPQTDLAADKESHNAIGNAARWRHDVSSLNVLFCDEHYKHTLGIVRNLGKLGVNVTVVAASHTSLACRSRYCHNVVLAKSSSIEDLMDAALHTVQSRQIDLMIPVSYSMTLAVARRRQDFCRNTRIELASVETIEKAADKLDMARFAQSIGVPAPRTMLAGEALRHEHDLLFPVVVKPQREYSGRPPVRYARTPDELRKMLSTTPPTASSDESELLVQEFIPGMGCGFFAIYQRGVCRRVFMHRRVREYPATGGVSTCAESFYDTKLETHGRRILDALNWHGVAMVEFRADSRDGSYKLIEVNPKFWGSLDLALAAGAQFPSDLCRMAMGDNLAFTDRYQRNLRFHWPFSSSGELFHVWTRPKSIFSVALDFLNPLVRSNVWLSDPSPNLLELRSLADRLFRQQRG